MADELHKELFMALGEAVIGVQDRFREGHTAKELIPAMIEALVTVTYFMARDAAQMDQLAFLGLCTSVAVLNKDFPDRPTEDG